MSGPVRPPLTVAESDGTPTVRPVNEIAFNSADFVVADQGGGTVRVDAHPGAGASLTDTYIGFGDGSNLLTGSANMTYDDTVPRLTLKTAGNNDVLRLIGTDTDANVAPTMLFRRDSGASGAAGDELGQISFNAEDAAGNDTSYAKFYAGIADPTASQESGRLYFRVRQNNSFRTFLKMEGATSGSTGSDDKGTIIWNEDGQDIDMRWEGVSNANAMRFDAENENLGIGTVPATGVALHIVDDGTDDMLRIESTDAGSSNAPRVELFRNSASPADGDSLGALYWAFQDDGGGKNDAGYIKAYISDASAGTEGADFYWYGLSGGTLYNLLAVRGGIRAVEVNVNEADVDFIANGDTVGELFHVDASEDAVGIGGTPSSDVERLHVKGTSTGTLVQFESTDDSGSASPDLVFYRNSASPADDDYISQVSYVGRNDNSQDVTYAKHQARILDATDGSEDGGYYTYIMKAGTLRRMITMTSSGMYINNDGYDFNFAVNDDNDDALLNCDAGLRKVAVGSGSIVSTGSQFQVDDDASFKSYTVNQNTSGIVDASLQKNGHIVCNPSGVNITVTLGGAGAIGEKVTIMNVAGDASTVLLAVAVGDSTLTTPATFASGDSETWFCYKDNNWMRINSQT